MSSPATPAFRPASADGAGPDPQLHPGGAAARHLQGLGQHAHRRARARRRRAAGAPHHPLGGPDRGRPATGRRHPRRLHPHRAELRQHPGPGGHAARPGAGARRRWHWAGSTSRRRWRHSCGSTPRSASSSTSPTASSTSPRKASTWPSATPRPRPIRMWPGCCAPAARCWWQARDYLRRARHALAPVRAGGAPVPAVPARCGRSQSWSFEREGGRKAAERVIVNVNGPLRANNSEVLREAVLGGLGIGLLPDFSARRLHGSAPAGAGAAAMATARFLRRAPLRHPALGAAGAAGRAMLRRSLAPVAGAGFAASSSVPPASRAAPAPACARRICAMPLPSGSLRSDAMPPPSSARVHRKFMRMDAGHIEARHRALHQVRQPGGHALLGQLFAQQRQPLRPPGDDADVGVSPLSPLRPQARRISGTSISRSRRLRLAKARALRQAAAAPAPGPLGIATGVDLIAHQPPAAPAAALSSRKANCLIAGAGPAGHRRRWCPGDQDVPAGAISRANSSSAAFCGCITATRSTASRTSAVRACGPKLPCSEPSTSISVRL